MSDQPDHTFACRSPSKARWRFACLTALAISSIAACRADVPVALPAECFQTPTDTPAGGSVIWGETPGSDRAWQALRATLPGSPAFMPGASIWSLRAKLDSMWSQDSLALMVALGRAIVDNRTTTTFSAVIAAQYYAFYRGSPDLLLARYGEAGEPADRLTWVLLGLTPPLSLAAESQVVGFACEAAWMLTELAHDPFLAARVKGGHLPSLRLLLTGILAEAERVTSGHNRQTVTELRRMTESPR